MRLSLLRRLVFFVVLPLAACAVAQPQGQPEWVAGASKKHPAAGYLIGRGSGSTAEEAQNRARGDLATVFEVRVEVVTGSSTEVNKSGNREQVDKRDFQQVTASTDKVIQGVSIAELWRDPKTMDFHALAILSRAQAAAGLREELGQIDASVARELTNADGASDPLLKIGALNRALNTAISRDGFQASLKVVDPSGVGLPPPTPQNVVREKIDAALKTISIAPVVGDDGGAPEFAGTLKAGLAAAGFLAKREADAKLALIGKLALRDLGQQNGWYWVRGTVDVSLVERAAGDRVRGGKSWPIKASAQDAKTARARALAEIEKLFKQELREAIIGFAAS